MTRRAFIAKIKRNLHLDSKTKNRVVEGIQTEIQLSLDAGLSINEAIEKLGQPKDIAGEYNRSYRDEPDFQSMRKVYRLKKVLVAFAVIIGLTASACAFIAFRPVDVDYGASEIFSKADLDAAVRRVKFDFATMFGCYNLSLRYAGDKRSQCELENANYGRIPGDEYVACIVFNSNFQPPKKANGAWSANSTYKWSWTIVKTVNGAWTVLDKGYA